MNPFKNNSFSLFRIKSKTWDDIEEDDPTPDEVEAIESYLTSK